MNTDQEQVTENKSESKQQEDHYLQQSTDIPNSALSIHNWIQASPYTDQISVRHVATGPINVNLSYGLSVEEARAMAVHLNKAAHMVENKEKPDDSPFYDPNIGIVKTKTDGADLTTEIAMGMEDGIVMLMHTGHADNQPGINQKMTVDDARKMAHMFESAAQELDVEPSSGMEPEN